jgi:serine/threonine-protein kinase HipA
MNHLEAFLHDQYVGTVRPDPRNPSRVLLDIDQDYEPDIVLSESFTAMPGRRAAIDAASSFLGGYVPEGDQRDRMAAKRGIDKNDLFALLREFGGSVAGAVTLRNPEESPAYRPTYEPLSDKALAAKLLQALKDADQGLPEDSRSTLPGYQPKVLVARFDGQWMNPHGRAHSTHILKPQVPARPSRVFDEHYSHQLAAQLDLATYESQIRRAGPMTYLAIERYDRRVDSRHEVRLTHQEDLAQALGLDWRDTDVKFQEEHHPTDSWPRSQAAWPW